MEMGTIILLEICAGLGELPKASRLEIWIGTPSSALH